MHRITRHRWLDIFLGLASGVALPAVLCLGFAAWYIDHLGLASPVLWDGYGLWFGTLALSLLLVTRMRDRIPLFAGAMLMGTCAASLALLLFLWLVDNGVGFSA